MSKLYKLMTVLSCLLLLALFAPLNATYAQTCTDGDGDGYGLNGDASCPNPGVDCDDTDVNVYPDAPLLCDAKDNNCDGWIDFSNDKDVDEDGVPLCYHWQTGLKDCDDNNPNRYPGNIEGPFGDATCSDGIDNDCNNRTDSADNGCSVNCNDIDGDGYGSPGNVTCPNGSALDCNNNNAAVNPGAPDAICNGVDNNCSGTPDDEYVDTPTNCGIGECGSSGLLTCSGGVEVDTCTPGTPIREICPNGLDDDCDGIPDASDPACGSCSDNDLDGYGFLGDASCANGTEIDCDDDNPAINPGAADDVCDGVDANCSGTPDDEYTPTVTNCGIGECATTGLLVCTAGATVDNCSPLAPGVEGPFGDPTCIDSLDNDCDGLVDAPDNDCNPLDQDNDGDGFCEVGPCQNPANLDGDCDDTDLNTYPGAPRLCDAIDNDCDGWQDFFTDKDVDGDGITLCTHWQTGLKDCDDNNANRFPGNIEGPFGHPSCTDIIDNDCDNKVDAADLGCDAECTDEDGDGYGLFGKALCTFPGSNDCDDGNININPGAADDNCDNVDNNCSGTPDDQYVDTPTNCGVGDCASTGTLTCSAGVESDSCVEGTPVVEGPLGDGTCSDTSDNDCDGTTDALDPGCQSLCLDDDGDGYGLYGHASCTGAGVDCDDKDPNINPGAADDNCDNVDNNCSGTPDDEYTPTVTNCGIGDCATTGLLVCTAGATADTCSPLAPGVEGPPGDPTCSGGSDEDCDGFIDGADIDCNPLDVDNDGDGFCEVGPCQNPANLGGDCNDADVITYPGAPRVCDAVDNDCDGWQDFFTDKDVDGDGVTLCTHWQTGLKDCDDNNADRFPGNIEIFGDPSCTDGIDNDCNNKIDNQDLKCLGPADFDGDGYCIPGHPSCPFPEEDCDDNNPNINPGVTDDTCDGVDNNCSGTPDDEYVDTPTSCGVGECGNSGLLTCSGGVEVDTCTPGTPIREICPNGLDDDCDGLPDASDPACGSCSDNDLDGYGFLGDVSCANGTAIDCDDDNAAINPGAADGNCDNVDDNCSGTADDEYTPTVTNCGVGECASTGFMNCNAGVLEDDCTPLPEGVEDYLTPLVCTDTLDNDCDGLIDQVPGIEDPDCNPLDVDNDGDNYCEVAPCQNTTPTSNGGDCDDTDPIVHPGGSTSICDAKDTNCDGWIDFFTDKDVDGDGVPLCTHWQTGLKDCDDNDAARYPGNKEGPWVDPTCFDGVDNDCSNEVDGLDPKCIEPTCATKTGGDIPPDGPHIFDLLDGNDNVLKTPCQWCHFNDAGTVDERTKCERCHADPAWGGPDDGTLKALYTDPPPYGFGTASNVRKHSSTVVGTTHGAWDMECITCHNPHLQEMNYRYETTYGKYIREKICFDNVVTSLSTEELVEFTAATGPGSFADGPPPATPEKNICQICHTLTNHHRNDGLAPGDWDGAPGSSNYLGHNDGGPDPCTNCHSHGEGFAPPVGGSNADVPHDGITDCTLCHDPGTYITGATLDSAKCLACHDGVTAIEADTHGMPGADECTDCHNPMRAQGANASHIKTSLATFTGGAGSFVNGGNNGICQTCHTATEHHQNDGTAPSGQNHNDAADCTSCHTHAGTGAADDAFRDHEGTVTLPGSHDGQACATCHDSGSYVDGFAIPNAKCTTCHDGVTAVDADLHFAAGQGSTCVECHNPMNDQAPNVKHVRTSLAVFTGGAGSFVNGSNNGICQTCHTATEHHQNDGTAPSGQNHNDATVCTTCHTHPGTGAADDGFRDHEGTQPPLPGTHNGQACTTCHDSGTYVDGAAIPNAKCTTCHDGVTAVEADAHFAAGQGSTCVECHNPMNDQAPNVKHVRTSLAVFTGGAGSFVNGSNNGICQTCHTATEHHQNDGTAPSGQNHNDATVCTSCHTHPGTAAADDGFRDHEGTQPPLPGSHAGQACDTCHDSGTYVTGAAIANGKCKTCHDGVTAIDADAHFAAGLGSTCVECHNPMSDQSPNVDHIRTSLAVFTGGAGSFVNGSNNGICQTCHTATNHHNNTGDAPGGQSHNDGLLCTSCHTHPGTGTANDAFRDHLVGSEADAPHNNTASPGLFTDPNCLECHNGTDDYVPGAAIPNAKCLVCHDGTPSTEADAHFGAGLGMTCVECHNPMSAQGSNASHIRTSLAVFTGGAGSFVNGSNNGICQTCHTATEHHQNDGTAPSGQNHNDGTVCTSCHTHIGSPSPNDGFRDHEGTVTLPGSHNGQACDSCHDSGSYVDGFAIPNAKCTTCHDGVTALDADLHFAAGQGSTCVECHNPMNDQAPNVKHVRTSLAVFTGGAGSFVNGSNNGICQTCHTATEHHQNDGTAPSGQNHNDATVCTTCHMHAGTGAADDGFRDHEGTVTLPGSHDGQACATCHDSGSYVDGFAIPNAKCQACHDGVTALDADLHFAAGQGSTCVECHNPMNDQAPNVKHVRTSLAVFTGGAGSFVNGSNNGICQTCHTATEHHQNDGTAPSGQNHNDATVCTSCHTHPGTAAADDGFRDHEGTQPPLPGSHAGQACDTCHDSGTYVTGAAIANGKCKTCHDGVTAIDADAHFAAGLGSTCVECHNPMSDQSPNVDHIRTSLATFLGGAGSFVNGSNNGICQTCHTATNHHNNTGDAPGGQSHNDGLLCTSCHTHPGTGTANDAFRDHLVGSEADAPHNNTASPGLFTDPNCLECHNGTDDYVPGAAIPNAKCLVCHDGTPSTEADAHFGAGLGMTCVECHNPMSAQGSNASHIRTSLAVFTGGAGSFVNGSNNGICQTCHTATEHHQNDGTAPSGQNHNDGTVCTSCHTHIGSPSPNDGFRDHEGTVTLPGSHNGQACDSCHDSGSYVDGFAIPNAKCTTCHDGVTALDADLHFAAGQGSTCVECHNPMNDQAPNVKHVRTSLAVFTGGAGSFVNGSNNGICQTCHTATEHHQNDGTAPSGQNHNDATVCTTCHMHAGTGAADDGFRDHEGTVTLPGSHDGQACATCHDSGSYVDGFAIPNAKCQACHDGVTALDADLHFAAGQGSTCVECHNPMNDQAPNVKHVRTSLAVFTGGAGSFVNGSNNGICQTCHTATEHHQNDGTAPSGQNHNDATVCTSCHTHPGTAAADDGFRDHEGTQPPLPGSHAGQACDTCHDSGTYVTGAAIANGKCKTCHDGVTAIDADAHFAAGLGSTCVECHNPMSDQSPNVDHIRTSLATFLGGAGSFVNGSNNGICQTCHTATNHHNNTGDAPGGQSHNDGLLCTSCHTHPGTGTANDAFRDHLVGSEADAPHNNTASPGLFTDPNCLECHNGTDDYVPGAAIPNAKCLVCHDGTPSTEADAHFGAGLGMTCVECHNPMSAQGSNASHIRTSLAVFTGGAGSFVNGSNNGICQTCHTATEHHQNDGTAPSGQNHNDGTVCTSCHTHIGSPSPNDGFRDHEGTVTLPGSHNGQACDSCHDSGSYVDGFAIPNAKCTTCHDGVTALDADLHFAAGQGSTCVECHNPMNDQAPNVKHVRTSLAVFTGGAGSFVNGSNNGICQTCHTATEHHQNDGTAPSGQNHNDATVCTTCHMHAGTGAADDGFRDHEGTVTLPGSHDGQACATCHDSGSYVDGFAIPNAKCQACHDGVTALDADLHFAAGQGSTCVECHNPMNDQAPNVKHVRTSLAVFTGGAGSFVNGSNNGICQTCHTATEHHQNDGTAPSGQNHNDATVCTSCHTHPGTAAADDGFRDHEGTQPPLPGSHAGQACDTCHDSGTYVTGAAIANGKCKTCHDGVTAIDADAHFAAGLGSTCVECHNPMSDQSPNVDHIRTSLATFLGGAGSFVNGSNNGICQTCHTATNHHNNTGDAPGGQSHNDGLLCTSCHTHPGTGTANDAFRDHLVGSEADAPHNNTASPGLFTDPNCLECHNGTDDYVPGAAIPNAKCLVCHDGTPSTEADAHFGAGLGMTCVECHNPMSAQGSNASHIRTSLAVFTGGAGSFVNGSNNGICQTCHTATEHHQNDGTAPSGQNHNDGTVCTSCHTHIGSPSPNDGFRDHEGTVTLPGSHNGQACDSCHDSGSYVDGFAIPNAKCTTCHDGVTALDADLHFAAGQGSTCVECHNPMNDQAPNVKHVRTSLAVFTGGAGSFVNGSNNGICQTCHTATEHHQNDGTAPSGQNHNDATVCTTCHMHAGTGAADDGFRDHEGTVTLPGSHDGQACATCHDSGSYVDGFAIPNAKCQACHDGVTALDADLHFAAGQGSTCVECHNPMNDQAPNVKHVRTSLAVFTGGAGSFVNGSNNGICQTCHTATEHHQNDGTAPSGQNHNDATVCTSCHTHPGTAAADDGFRDHEGTQPPLPGSHAGQACDTCHDSGTYVTGAAIANGKCKTCHDGVTAIDADAHFAAGLGSTCVECHNPMSDQSPNVDHIRTSLATFLGGAGSFVNGSNNGICQTCHTATNHHNNTGDAPGGQSHNDGLLCTSCHTHPGTGTANDAFRDHLVGSEADAPHNNTASPGLFTDPNCLECHNGTDDYVPGAAIPNAKCLVCHDGTPSTEADAHFGAGLGMTCVECHNPMSAQGSNASHIRTSLAVFTGGAGSFVNGSNNGICQTCHTATEHHQNDGTAPSGQNHNDGTVCTSCHTHIGSPSPNDGFRDHEGTVTLPGSHNGQACDSCHDSGSYVDGFAIPNAKCTTCHDGVTALDADLHFAAGQGSTCVECHNPMNDQAPNVKHVRTSLAVFTGGAGSFVNGSNNGICQTCHTATEHHQNDGTAPSGQNHNDATVCTTCHMHPGTGAANDGFRDHEGTVTLPGSHDGQACDTCHDSGSYVDGFAIPNAKCQACHDGVTALEADVHWPAGLGSTCVECHNPMNDQAPNVKHVRTSLAVFTGGAGSFVNGGNNGICQTCHTLTEHHQNDGTAPSGQNHNDATVCTTCHMHPGTGAANDGFRDHEGTVTLPGSHDGQACDTCHDSGSYVDGFAIPNAKCQACHDGVTALEADVHWPAGLGSTCVECHNPMNDQSPNVKHVRTSLAVFTGGAGSFVNGSNNGICQTCHTLTEHHQNDGTAPSGQNHNDATVCTTCHMHPGTGAANDGFRDHEGTVTLPGSHDGQACDTCHDSGSYVDGFAIPNAKCQACHDGVTALEADVHWPAGLGSTCVECHNPMNDQSPNVKHVRTSLAVFTGGAGSFVNGSNNGICQTCHTLTEHHQNDGTAPSGQNHNDATVCTTCHMHPGTGAANDGFRDHEGTVTLPGTHNGQACDTCHDSGSYVDGFAIPNAKCQACHDGVTALEADVHWPAGLGSTCVECHNPMNDQSPNVKHVRTSLAVFTGGAGSFVNGSNNGICQTCHTLTEHHQNDGTAPSGQNHNDATVCTTCHMHPGTGAANDGFRDHEGTVTLPGTHNGQACDTCHDSGSYVDGFAIPNAKCQACHDGVTALEADVHWPAGLGSTCVECHNPMNDQSPNVKHVRTSLAVFTGGAGSFVNGSNNGICQTCHTLTEHHQNDGTAPSGQNHNDATVCTTCHMHPGTGAANDGFRDHEGTVTLPGTHNGQACDTCHDSGSYVDGFAIPNAKCQACHDGVTALEADVHWPAGLGSTCVECHNPMNDQSPNVKHVRTSLAVFTGGAGSFVNGSNNGICQTCHTLTEHHQNDGTAPSGQNHNDATVCTTCHTHPGTGAANDGFRDHEGTVTLPGSHDGQACDTCHDSGSYVDGFAIPNAKCQACHDGVTALEADVHWPAGLGSTCVECHNPMNDQAPNVKHVRTSLAVFTGGAGSFVNGTNNGICQTCHTATEHHQNDGTAPSGQNHNDAADCTTCHTHPGTGAANDGFRDHEGTVTLPGTHNGQACDTCHDSGSYVDGFAIPNAKCQACHDGVTAVEADTHFAAGQGSTCVECHNPMNDQAPNASHIRTSLATFLGGAGSFVNGSNNGICQTCHTATNHHQNDGTAPGGQSHNDATVCTGCHTHPGTATANDAFRDQGASAVVEPPHDAASSAVFADCTVCHINAPGDFSTPVTNTECNACHGPGSPGVGTLYDYSVCRTESGTTNILNGNASRTITLGTAITDINQAFLLLDSAGGAAVENGQDHMVSGDIISASQVQFDRTGSTGQAEISYAVVECKNNEFGVESGQITLTNGTATNTANLATTVDPARAIVIVSGRSNSTDASQSPAHVTGEVVGGGTQVQVTRASGSTGADTIVTYQVVEFSVNSGVTVQTGETTLGSGQSTTAAVSIPSLSDAWLYFSYDASDEGPQQTAVSGQITNPTTLTFERHANNTYTNRIRWYVVTFPTNEVTVQRGSSAFSGGATTHNIGISPVSAVTSAFTFVSNTTADTGGTGGGGPTVNNYHVDIGTGNYGGLDVDHTTCTDMNTGQVGILVNVASFPGSWACASYRIDVDNTAGNVEGTWVFTTPYAQDTPIDSGTIWAYIDERDRNDNTVVRMELGYVSGGSFTSFGSTDVNVLDRADGTYTFDMSGATGTAPAGSVLAIRVIDLEGAGSDRYIMGTGSDASGTIRMTVTETGAGGATNAYPINRWTEVLSSTSNIQLTNGRGTDTDSNAGFEWQVVEFTGSGPVQGIGSDKNVDTHMGNQYNDPTTGSLVTLDCIECHNPMQDSSSNLTLIRDTLRSMPVVFTTRNNMADGTVPYNGVCEACHTQTSHYRNDGSSPSMPHNPGSICTDCHLHLGNGFDKDALPDTPHDTAGFLANCDYCHVTPTDYTTPVPDNKCNQCHTPGGALKGSYPTAVDVLTHSDSGGSGDFTFTRACIDCHNVMDPQLPNLSHIRTDVNGSVDLGSIIAFTAQENAGSFSDGAPYRDNICDTCHSDAALNYHHYDGNAPIDQDHNINTNCAAVCHPHSTGFQADIAPPPFPHDTQACNTCHTAEPDYVTPIDNTACMTCHDGTPALLVDTHHGTKYNDPTTSQPLDLNCVECHNPMTAQTNLSFIRDTLRGRTVVFTATSGPNSFADGDATYDGVCEVCHTQTGHHRFDGSDGTAHNDEADCTVACHLHEDAFRAPAGECITCHNGIPAGGPGYVLRDVVGADFTQASRHVFGGTVSNWDCIICHREGDAVAATSGAVSTTGVHINSQVEMRNVDSENTGWVWDKNLPPNDAMHSDMDTFCMSCHDGNGASAIAVRSDDAGVTLTPTGAEAARPFNSSDEPSAGTLGGTVEMAGYERTSVLDAFTQFDPNNPSHHAVRAPAYSSHNSNWGNGAWVSNSLKSGQALTTVYEAAQLHCADCHTVDSADGGAHGGANGFMLQASSIDGTCYLCHNSNVYSNNSSTLTRWSHDSESSVWGDYALIGNYGGNPGSTCLNCHGGKIGEGGSMAGYDGYGGIHGMSGTDARSGQTKFRFQGGAYMAHDPGTAGWTGSGGSNWGCYFAGNSDQDWSSCNKHSGSSIENGSRDMAPQYSRGTPGQY